MNWKKIGLLSILAFMLSPLLMVSVMAADTIPVLKPAWDWFVDKIVPKAALFSTGTAQLLGVLALIVIFVILLDIANLVLPFGTVTRWIIVIVLTLGALAVGIIRAVAGWGLAIGSLIAGGVGTLAIILSAVLMAAVLLALFWGGNRIVEWVKSIKVRRENIEAIYQARKRGGQIAAIREQEATGAGIIIPK